MDLKTFLNDPTSMSAASLAREIGVQVAQVQQWKHRYNNRRPSAAYCISIERVTAGAVTRIDLRPDDYWLIWPDLPAPELAHEAAMRDFAEEVALCRKA